jgi:hypothetical protein
LGIVVVMLHPNWEPIEEDFGVYTRRFLPISLSSNLVSTTIWQLQFTFYQHEDISRRNFSFAA